MEAKPEETEAVNPQSPVVIKPPEAVQTASGAPNEDAKEQGGTMDSEGNTETVKPDPKPGDPDPTELAPRDQGLASPPPNTKPPTTKWGAIAAQILPKQGKV